MHKILVYKDTKFFMHKILGGYKLGLNDEILWDKTCNQAI